MEFVLILLAVNFSTPTDVTGRAVAPTRIGEFSTMKDCQDAATGAKIFYAGKGSGDNGGEFLCVWSK